MTPNSRIARELAEQLCEEFYEQDRSVPTDHHSRELELVKFAMRRQVELLAEKAVQNANDCQVRRTVGYLLKFAEMSESEREANKWPWRHLKAEEWSEIAEWLRSQIGEEGNG